MARIFATGSADGLGLAATRDVALQARLLAERERLSGVALSP